MKTNSEALTTAKMGFIEQIHILQKTLEKDPLKAKHLLKEHKDGLVAFIDKLIVDEIVRKRDSSNKPHGIIQKWQDPAFREKMVNAQRKRREREAIEENAVMYLVSSPNFGEQLLSKKVAAKLLRITPQALSVAVAISRGKGSAVYRGNFFDEGIESIVTVTKVNKNSKEQIAVKNTKRK